ncbi:MAG: hypothetical protein E6K93_01310 [Thaumarchaeota archaeon]|nr:MAG: hypothetical protein E6K93_01310 [Nitrososphaerota archaeon]
MPKDTKSNGLADIVYSNNQNQVRKSERKPVYIKDELDEPKYKIANPELFAKSREILGNLISKRMKTSGGTDIDWLIEHNGGFIILELKTFFDDRILISKAQMSAYMKLYENLLKCHILFIGHDDIVFTNLDDPVWLFEISQWRSGAVPHVERSLTDTTYNENEVTGYRVEREFMEKIDVKILRDKIDSIWLEFEHRII